jgi:lipopolysaccharide/colanic/teichoic acid biosynthesis glycosyltransferase
MLLKRLFDILFSFVGLITFVPLFIILLVLIWLKMPGSFFFTQKRVGKNAALFTMVKFRTMTQGNLGTSISIKGQIRITPLGAILRKYKLDELPELWNVLIGDMSFVGPRPDVPGYADNLKGENRLILSVKPGITSPASIKYSNEEELLSLQIDPTKFNDEVLYPDKVRINLNYIKHRTFWLDLKIIMFTILGKKMKEPYFN